MKKSRLNKSGSATQTKKNASPSRAGGRRAIWWFGLKFGALMALYYVLALTPFVDRIVLPDYLKVNAVVSSRLLNMFGQNTSVQGSTLSSTRLSLTIKRGCDALEPSWFLASALLAFPGAWRIRWAGVGLGIVSLQILNVIRILSLYFIGIYLPDWFATFHLEIWPVIFLLTALLLSGGWCVWMKRYEQGTAKTV
jgi:exosortase/archaeosortase family protein